MKEKHIYSYLLSYQVASILRRWAGDTALMLFVWVRGKWEHTVYFSTAVWVCVMYFDFDYFHMPHIGIMKKAISIL